ncbi:probable protein S-acyltransferase 15 isoform X2 [Rhododendron vialii]|uniref:probable protein S-acyltransferase 15 isoform X2 n=1 Tax=Rhododendron vialii TaxID=182163 RepID=UPI00265DC555|nr:probable protein S-acyltransferase 15 isoform X2 [Rhododendron vialii]
MKEKQTRTKIDFSKSLESSSTGTRERESMKGKRFLSIPVFSVFLLLGFIYYVAVFVFIENWVGLQSSAGSLNALIFTFLASLCVFSFLVCVLTDPGGVPPAYVPDFEASEASDQALMKSGTQLRQCAKCSAYKPPRAHHCRSCRRCILRMDHHCMWINNCVGHRNYKAFVVLVFYAAMSSLYSAIVCGVMTVGLFLTLGTLLGWHIFLISHNMTTIERYDVIRAAWLARKSGQSYRHPFDVGVYKNITLVFFPSNSVLACVCVSKKHSHVYLPHGSRSNTFWTCSDMLKYASTFIIMFFLGRPGDRM